MYVHDNLSIFFLSLCNYEYMPKRTLKGSSVSQSALRYRLITNTIFVSYSAI